MSLNRHPIQRVVVASGARRRRSLATGGNHAARAPGSEVYKGELGMDSSHVLGERTVGLSGGGRRGSGQLRWSLLLPDLTYHVEFIGGRLSTAVTAPNLF